MLSAKIHKTLERCENVPSAIARKGVARVGSLARRCTKQTGKQGPQLSFDSRAPRYPTGDTPLPVI